MTEFTSHSEAPPPSNPTPQPRRFFGLVVLILLAAGLAAGFFFFVLPWLHGTAKPPEKQEPSRSKLATVQLVEGKPETIFVPADVRRGLGIEGIFEIVKGGKVVRETNGKKAAGVEGTFLVEKPKEGKPLLMPGTTALDPLRIRRIRSRFQAEIVRIGQVTERAPKSDREIKRDLRPGDHVKDGEELAVLWSIEVGMRKSDLADAIVQLRLDEQRLKDRIELFRNGNLPLDLLNQTRRDVITDRTAVDRAERNLLVWKVPEKEIEEVRQEAEKQASLQTTKVELPPELTPEEKKKRIDRWATSALYAPITGTIIEDNIGGVGEFLPDSTVNLITIADVSHLQVLAYPPEDVLTKLLDLKPGQMFWSIRTVGADIPDVPVEGIGYILDPNQHTLILKGSIENPERKGLPGQYVLRAGQYVTASVRMPPPPDVVEIPLTALAEDGRLSFVFVQPDPTKYEYTMRRVQVVARFEETAYVRSELTTEERDQNTADLRQNLPPREPLTAGQRVLAAGVLELRSALDDMMSKK
jgi:cobalt-zinc-cadmium efflux system membrane fusion protein